MKIIRGIYNLPTNFGACVLTLGNFDGVHLGHQALISRAVELGKEQQLPTVVMMFEPQPLEFFDADKAPSRLTSFAEKYALIDQLGVDYLLVIPFNRTFAMMTADKFIEHGLITQLQAKYIIIGDDFRFGAKRQGDIHLLQHYADQAHFRLECLPTLIINQQRVSSTAIRNALMNNDFKLAAQMLGRSYCIEGRVVYGNQLARQLGFPTANIHLNRKKPALHGVYFVKVLKNSTEQYYYGIANIGIRPTINGKHAVLEVHIFDFDQMIYGQSLQVEFIQKIRDETKFSSLPALQAQIEQDICIARQIKAQF